MMFDLQDVSLLNAIICMHDCRMASQYCWWRTCKSHIWRVESNSAIAHRIPPPPASACLLKAVSLPPRLAELTNTQWSQKAAESRLMRCLWWLICFISTSSFHLVKRWPPQRRSTAAPENSSACRTLPRSPFDQSHSRLIRPSFTLNRSN